MTQSRRRSSSKFHRTLLLRRSGFGFVASSGPIEVNFAGSNREARLRDWQGLDSAQILEIDTLA